MNVRFVNELYDFILVFSSGKFVIFDVWVLMLINSELLQGYKSIPQILYIVMEMSLEQNPLDDTSAEV